MKPHIVQPIWDNAPTARLYYGLDVMDGLKLLADASVHTVCTSPPYWGLRDYGGDGQVGVEKTPDEFVAKLVEVFREVARVLRPDGTLWINLGDSYANDGKWGGETSGKHVKSLHGSSVGRRKRNTGLKPKDLVGIPWRVAFALQADGWYLRSDILWVKSSCMPESVRDRPTKAHEYVFLFAHPDSGGRYFYDSDAIKEPLARPDLVGKTRNYATELDRSESTRMKGHPDGRGDLERRGVSYGDPEGRNKRSWWNINPKPYKGAHFAVWPPDLVRPMILAGTSEKGCCSSCGGPQRRDVQREKVVADALDTGNRKELHGPTYSRHKQSIPGGQSLVSTRVVGGTWVPTCECAEGALARCVVLDPFSGSATTGMVALQEGRDYIGIDLNAGYLALAEARILGEKAPPTANQEAAQSLVEELFG